MTADLQGSETVSRIARELLRDIAESARDAVVCSDTDGLIRLVNRNARELFGYSSAELIGQPVAILIPEFMKEGHVTGFNSWADSGNRTANGTSTVSAVCKDGEVISVDLFINTLPFDGRDYVVAVFEDVTEDIRKRESLSKAHNRYRTHFENSPLALCLVDCSGVKNCIDELLRSGVGDLRTFLDEHSEVGMSCLSMIRIVDANRAACDLAGVATMEEIVAGLTSDINKSFYELFKEQVAWLAAGNLQCDSKIEDITVSGKPLALKLTLTIAPEFSSCWSEVTVSLSDVTKKKRRERQLVHTTKMEAVGRLTGGVAHDFNNVLTVISGNLRLILDTSGHEMDRETREMIEDALSAADDGAELTTRLLALSKKPTSKADRLDVEAVVLNSTELMKRTLGGGIEISVDISDDLAKLEVDRSAFENVLLNLSINARDAMKDGGTLTFKASNGTLQHDVGTGISRLPAAMPCVVIEVIDTGIGMPEEVVAHAIEPFYTTKSLYEGNGLGLSIVQDFVTGSGGRLKIDSTVGSGTNITLQLPLQPVD